MRKIIIIVLALALLISGCSSASSSSKQQIGTNTKAEESTKNTSETQKEATLSDNQTDDVYSTRLNEGTSLGIVRKLQAADFSSSHAGMQDLPKYDPTSNYPFQVDIRSTDVSKFNLLNRLNDLLYADFDSKTKWPNKLPKGFKPEKIMELGKDPGLNVRELHEMGITGKGVGIVFIDQGLLVDHIEYKDILKTYEEIHLDDECANMHASAVASIAVGKNVGVAPEADLYFIAASFGEDKDNGEFEIDFTYTAKSIDRIIEINKSLPTDRKIRVISISAGWMSNQKGYQEMTEAVERAKKENIFVISSTLQETYGFSFLGLGRNPLKDPNAASSYGPGLFWTPDFFSGRDFSNFLMVPMDSRCTASPTGENDYVFYNSGGISWSVPYLAGLYALACQANPDITPETFWSKAIETGDTTSIMKDRKSYNMGVIANPLKLINSIKK